MCYSFKKSEKEYQEYSPECISAVRVSPNAEPLRMDLDTQASNLQIWGSYV